MFTRHGHTQPQVMLQPIPEDPRQKWAERSSSPQRGDRSPERWIPKNVTVPAEGPTQPNNGSVLVSGPTVGRKDIIINNTGANPIRIRPIANLNSAFFTLNANTPPLTLETEGEIWVSSPIGSSFDVIETWFELLNPAEGENLQGSIVDVLTQRTLEEDSGIGGPYPERL